MRVNREILEGLYAELNRRELVCPDPLQFLYAYDDPADIEVAGLVASSLAYGRVAQILRSVESVLRRMGKPAHFVRTTAPESIFSEFEGFKHRFTTGEDLAVMLCGAARAIERHGSLEAAFAAGLGTADENIVPALAAFVCEVGGAQDEPSYLLPSPAAGSACKRLNLYLRWMVRRDAVDPGCWRRIPAAKLLVPLDTHMHRISLALGLTARRQADLKAAVEVTAAFRLLAPDDPVKYDFALTRLGIRAEMDTDDLFARCARREVA